MGNISKHFDREEFDCNCGKCTPIAVDKVLLEVLENVRETFGQPVTINSAYRCENHNCNVGGSVNSMHLTGKASDIVVSGIRPKDVQAFLLDQYPDTYGIGKYDTFTHIDVRDVKARW